MTSETIFKSLFFIPYYDEVIHGYYPIIENGWTLNFEMFFYIVFGSTLIFKRWNLQLVLITFLFALSVIFLRETNGITYVMGNPILFEFVYGMFLGKIYHTYMNRIRIPRYMIYLLTILSVLIFCYGTTFDINNKATYYSYRAVVYGLPCLLLVFSVMCLETKANMRFNKLLLKIGDASYTLYLSHVFFLPVSGRIWKFLHLDAFLNNDMLFLFSSAFCIAISIVLYENLEKRITQLLTVKLLPRRKDAKVLAVQ